MFAHEVDDILVVPVVQSSLSDLHPHQQFPYQTRFLLTWKCWLLMHLASCTNIGCMIFENSFVSMTSSISSTSFRNMTSFGELTFGQ